jgi:hypothetical protein
VQAGSREEQDVLSDDKSAETPRLDDAELVDVNGGVDIEPDTSPIPYVSRPN